MKNLNNYIVEHLEYSTFPIIERLHINKDSMGATSDSFKLDICNQIMNNINWDEISFISSDVISEFANNFNKQDTPLSNKYQAVSIFDINEFNTQYKDLKIGIDIAKLQETYHRVKFIKEHGNLIIFDTNKEPILYINIFMDDNIYINIKEKINDDKSYFENKDMKAFIIINCKEQGYKVYSTNNLEKEL